MIGQHDRNTGAGDKRCLTFLVALDNAEPTVFDTVPADVPLAAGAPARHVSGNAARSGEKASNNPAGVCVAMSCRTFGGT
jgi:hypothetical protein